MEPNNHPIILFDGVCGLCNSAVDFIMKLDRHGVFRFTPLQGETGQQILQQYDLPIDYLDSILLLDNGKLHRESAAMLQVLRKLPFPFPMVYPLIFLPKILRDPGLSIHRSESISMVWQKGFLPNSDRRRACAVRLTSGV